MKSFSRSPLAHLVFPRMIPWIRCPYSWKKVMTSSRSMSPGPSVGLGKIADQDIFRKPKAVFAGGQGERGVVFVFVFPRKHVEVNPADQLALVVDVIRPYLRMPNLAPKSRACK